MSQITSLPYWILFIIVTSIGMLTAEAGSLLHSVRQKKGIVDKDGSSGSLIGAMLGLLAFILGFTFSITASRYSDRKNIVVEQARTISNCYFRTSLIPDSQKLETRRLLRQYIEVILEAPNSFSIEDNITRVDSLHRKIWEQAASLIHVNMDGEIRALYISSINELIDTFNKRKTVVLVFRIPETIWMTLLLLYLLCMFVVGPEISSVNHRRRLNLLIMTAAYALIVVLIAEMDTPTKTKVLRVNQQPLRDVQEMIQKASKENTVIIKAPDPYQFSVFQSTFPLATS